MTHQPMTHDFLESIPTADLRRELERRQASRPAAITRRSAQLTTAAAATYGITAAEALKSRNPLAVRARWAAWMQLALDGYSSTQIARAFHRDHGSVTNAWRRSIAITQTDGRYAACIAHLGTLSQPQPQH